jgi:uncharacterized damage-inducible protein DinB
MPASTTLERATRTIADSLLAEFENEVRTTRKFLERVPESHLTWKPHEKSMTAGQLALHIAEVPAGVLEAALQDEMAPPQFGDRRQPASLGDILDALDHSVDYVRRTLPTIDDDRMRAIFKVVENGRTLMSLVRAEFLRSIMLNHWYHHRGQLGVYLRLRGVAVPASYGPSADETPF